MIKRKVNEIKNYYFDIQGHCEEKGLVLNEDQIRAT